MQGQPKLPSFSRTRANAPSHCRRRSGRGRSSCRSARGAWGGTGPAGQAARPGGGQEPVLGEATTLDVQLEMELLKTEERKEPIPEEIFERLSRQEKSTLNYEALSQRGSYAEDSALGHESLPWIYRSLVKQYFLSLVSKSEAKSESGSSK